MRKLLLYVTLLVSLLPLVQHRLSFFGETALAGMTIGAARPRFSLSSFLSGDFQTQFTNWFEDRFSFKGELVTAENSMNLALFGDVSSRSAIPIIRGKRNHLFEMVYIDNFNGINELKGTVPTPSALPVEDSVRLLARAARIFQQRGINFVLVLYPHKAWIYPEYIPEKWLLNHGEFARKGLQRLRQLLDLYKVPYVDGPRIFKELKKRGANVPLYNPGGTHWTDASACYVFSAMMRVMSDQTPRRLPQARCASGEWSLASGTDMDIAEIMNVWDETAPAARYFGFNLLEPFQRKIPATRVTLSSPMHHKLSALFIRTSFSEHLMRLMQQSRLVSDIKSVAYYHPDLASEFGNWDETIFSRQIVVFEQSQASYLTSNITWFLDDLEKNSAIFRESIEKLPSQATARADGGKAMGNDNERAG